METTGGDASWLNGKNEIHNRSIHNMVREALLDSDQHENKWFCAAEISSNFHRCIIHSALEKYHLTLHGMVKILASINSENLDVLYTPSHHLLKIYIT